LAQTTECIAVVQTGRCSLYRRIVSVISRPKKLQRFFLVKTICPSALRSISTGTKNGLMVLNFRAHSHVTAR